MELYYETLSQIVFGTLLVLDDLVEKNDVSCVILLRWLFAAAQASSHFHASHILYLCIFQFLGQFFLLNLVVLF